MPGGRPPQNLAGKRSGSVVAIEPGGYDSSGLYVWRCRCDCGKELLMRSTFISKQQVKSCGCKNLRGTKHGLTSRKSEHYKVARIYHEMRRRCEDSNNSRYADYGGRGVQVCERWKDSIQAFVADMGPRPSSKHQIDRIDNSKGYSPDNCRWSTPKNNSRNRRDNRWLSYQGETKTLAEWCEKFAICHSTVLARLRNGWSVERALTQPTHLYRNRKELKK